MAPFILTRLEEEDIPAFCALDAAAMAGWNVARAIENANTTGESREKMVEDWMRKDWRNDDEVTWLKMVDSESGEMAAAALWRFNFQGKPKQEPTAREEVKEVKGLKDERSRIDRITAKEAMRILGDEFRKAHIGDKPHAYLAVCITHPKYQRQGAGTTLVKWGCDKADERGVITALIASPAGVKLYQNCGFKVVLVQEMDLKPYGVDEIDLRRCMIREPVIAST